MATSKIPGSFIEGQVAGGGAGSKNRIINGDMRIWQRGITITSPSNGNFAADRWQYLSSGAGVVTISEDTSEVPNGVGSSLKVDVTTADASLAASDEYTISQIIEGYNVVDLRFGDSGAKQLTLSFYVRSPKTGLHYVSFSNGALNRSYVASYTVDSADTWEQKTITITADTSGTWLYTSGAGLRVRFNLAAGANLNGTVDTWQAGSLFNASGAVNVMDNTANNFYLADVQLEVGPVATEFEILSIGQELELCKRYFQRLDPATTNAHLGFGAALTTTNAVILIIHIPEFRATPTVVEGTAGDFTVSAGAGSQVVQSWGAEIAGKTASTVRPVVSSGLIVGQATRFFLTAAQGTLDFDSEL